MKKFLLQLFLTLSIFSFYFFFEKAPLYAQNIESPLQYEGGADIHLYKHDTIMLENVILDDGSPIEPAQTFTAGASFFHSPNISMFYVPLKYSLNDYLEINFSLPYITKIFSYNSMSYTKEGYGDTKIGFTFSYLLFSSISSNSHFKMTFPTGDEEAQDNSFFVPMGHGNFTFSFLQSFSTPKNSTLRFFCNAGIVYYTKSSRRENSIDEYNFDDYYVYSGLAGIETYLSNMYLQLKTNYVHIPERKYQFEDSSNNSVSDWTDFNDSITSVDVIPAIKYYFLDNIIGNAMLICPVYEKQDNNIAETHKRKWKFFISFEKRFLASSRQGRWKSKKSGK